MMIDWPEVLDYLSSGDIQAGIRPIREGRALLKSVGLVAVVNRQQQDDESPVIEAHCLQSKITEKPHKIEVNFKISNSREIGEFMEIEAAECSCTAASGKCKHIVATLLYLEKTSIHDIDTELSSTELKQKWGQSKEMYTPRPLKQFCCFKEEPVMKKVNEAISKLQLTDLKEFQKNISNSILNEFPNSAFKLQKEGRKNINEVNSIIQSIEEGSHATNNDDFPINIKELVTSVNRSISMEKLSDLPVPIFPIQNDNFKNYYEEYIKISSEQCCKIFYDTQGQENTEWNKQRQVRITGSVAHPYLTYTRNRRNLPRDWNQKLQDTIFSKFTGNADTRYGIENEPTALELYQQQNSDSEIVTGAGILVNEKCPWFGYSADGFEITSDGEVHLLEVKCPRQGKNCGALELFSHCSFLKCDKVDKKVYNVNKSDRYYTQMQLGMMLMNISNCKLLIYSEKTTFVESFLVPYEEQFCTSLFIDLTKTYFDYLLPFYHENKHKMIISRSVTNP